MPAVLDQGRITIGKAMICLFKLFRNRRQRRAERRSRREDASIRFNGLEALESRLLMSGSNANELINTSLTPEQLAQSLVGAGVAVTNVTYTGGSASTGSFSFADSKVVGFSQGILLSSGSAADVVGPNVSDLLRRKARNK